MSKFSLDLFQDTAKNHGNVVLLSDPGGDDAIHVRHRNKSAWRRYVR